MSKLKNNLQKHLLGEVLDSSEILEHYSKDGSIFQLTPKAVVYPRNTEDVRKLARISWQLAERGQQLPLTARGTGSDKGGAALGSGLVLVFPPHMQRPLELSERSVTVEPGLLYRDLQNTLISHGRFLPPYPVNLDLATIGGAVANNTSGVKSVKYGCSRDYVQRLEVVLANGQLISTERLSAKEVNKKKGQTNLEGEIYRKLDALLGDNADLIDRHRSQLSSNTAGYHLWDVRAQDGSIDLTPLLVGSQGTLGLITKITLRTEPYQPKTHLLTAVFDDYNRLEEALKKLADLTPSALELIDRQLLKLIKKHDPYRLEGLVTAELPQALLLIEFDDKRPIAQSRKAKKAQKLLDGLAQSVNLVAEPAEQERYWRLRYGEDPATAGQPGPQRPLPIIEDGVVPLDKVSEFMQKTRALLKKHHLDTPISGHAGSGNFYIRPRLDIGNVGDRQRIFVLMDEFYEMVIALGGSTSGSHNDGRLRSPYLAQLYGKEMLELFDEVKAAFDPHGTLNPKVKVGVSQEDQKGWLRKEYSQLPLHSQSLPVQS